jgi:hypothetical protein
LDEAVFAARETTDAGAVSGRQHERHVGVRDGTAVPLPIDVDVRYQVASALTAGLAVGCRPLGLFEDLVTAWSERYALPRYFEHYFVGKQLGDHVQVGFVRTIAKRKITSSMSRCTCTISHTPCRAAHPATAFTSHDG